MRDLEVDTETAVVAEAWKRWGIKGSKLRILGDDGYPDRIFWIPGGRPMMIEFKRSGFDLEPKQEYIHDELKRLGYDVEAHDNTISALQALARAVEAAKKASKSANTLRTPKVR